MKLVGAQPAENLQAEIKRRFAEFNRSSAPSKGRRYPDALQELACRAVSDGIPPAEVRRLTGLSPTALSRWIKAAKPKVPRRLKVVGVVSPKPASSLVVVRLPSGVSIELSNADALSAGLLVSLATLEAKHAPLR